MAKLKIVWHTTAYNRYSSIISWYVMNCGKSFAKTFIDDIDKKLEVLSFMPSLGRTKRIIGKKNYAEFVSHPKTIIRYWYDEKELHIIDFKPTNTKIQ